MASFELEVEKFDGRNDFELWKIKMRALLSLQGTLVGLQGKDKLPETMTNSQKEELLEKAHDHLKSGR